jgi:hypothetical protein
LFHSVRCLVTLDRKVRGDEVVELCCSPFKAPDFPRKMSVVESDLPYVIVAVAVADLWYIPCKAFPAVEQIAHTVAASAASTMSKTTHPVHLGIEEHRSSHGQSRSGDSFVLPQRWKAMTAYGSALFNRSIVAARGQEGNCEQEGFVGHSVRCLVTLDRKVRGDKVIRRRHFGRRRWESTVQSRGRS